LRSAHETLLILFSHLSLLLSSKFGAIPCRASLIWHRLFNTIVIWLLRSPLHRLLDRQMMVMTVVGRRRGKRYTFPVSYIRDGEILMVISRRERTWWKHLQGGAPVTLTFEGHQVKARAEVFTETETVMSDLLQVKERMRAFESVFHLTLDATGQLTQPEALTALASAWVTIRVGELVALHEAMKGTHDSEHLPACSGKPAEEASLPSCVCPSMDEGAPQRTPCHGFSPAGH
jgi:hypothetical protein